MWMAACVFSVFMDSFGQASQPERRGHPGSFLQRSEMLATSEIKADSVAAAIEALSTEMQSDSVAPAPVANVTLSNALAEMPAQWPQRLPARAVLQNTLFQGHSPEQGSRAGSTKHPYDPTSSVMAEAPKKEKGRHGASTAAPFATLAALESTAAISPSGGKALDTAPVGSGVVVTPSQTISDRQSLAVVTRAATAIQIATVQQATAQPRTVVQATPALNAAAGMVQAGQVVAATSNAGSNGNAAQTAPAAVPSGVAVAAPAAPQASTLTPATMTPATPAQPVAAATVAGVAPAAAVSPPVLPAATSATQAAAPQAVQAAAPTLQAGPSVAQAAPVSPGVQAGPPAAQAAPTAVPTAVPTVAQAAPPAVQAAPPAVQAVTPPPQAVSPEAQAVPPAAQAASPATQAVPPLVQTVVQSAQAVASAVASASSPYVVYAGRTGSGARAVSPPSAKVSVESVDPVIQNSLGTASRQSPSVESAAGAGQSSVDTTIIGSITFMTLIKALCMAGNILVQVSPYPQVQRWEACQCTGEADAAPYVSIAFGGWQWCYYGLFAFILTKRNGFLILVHSNFLGAVLGTYYSVAFYRHCHNAEGRNSFQKYMSAVGTLILLQSSALLVLPIERALFLTGLISSFCSFVGALSMLVSVPTVIRTKDSRTIPGSLVIANIFSSLIWCLCGWILEDPLIAAPNIVGFSSSFVCLVLKHRYAVDETMPPLPHKSRATSQPTESAPERPRSGSSNTLAERTPVKKPVASCDTGGTF